MGGTQNILILGGYGLIGSAITRLLVREGHSVTGLGRSARKGLAVSPDAKWISADLSDLTTPEDWKKPLEGVDVVINASGILQSGFRDQISVIQTDAICALISACEASGTTRFIQISAPGASESSDTEFYRSKASADDFLKASGLNWTIFRPGLVLSPSAYGGTSLSRLLSAFPVVQPIILPDAPIQTVWVEDVAQAVNAAIEGDICGDFDLVGADTPSLRDLTLAVRSWLGFSPPVATIVLPSFLGWMTAGLADIAGLFGWRTALRTTSLKVLTSGVTGDPNPWRETSGQTCLSLGETLRQLPSTAQERIYARVMLAFPVCLLVLSFFWIASGVIGFISFDDAVAVLDGKIPEGLSTLSVAGGSVADILVGVGLLIRPFTRKAAIAGALLAGGYALASLIFTPGLWLDPLGPMMKTLPVIAFMALIASVAEER